MTDCSVWPSQGFGDRGGLFIGEAVVRRLLRDTDVGLQPDAYWASELLHQR